MSAPGAKAIIGAAKSWAARRAPVKVSLAPLKARELDLRYYAPAADPEDVTGGNGDG